MDIQALKYFLVSAKHLNYTKAAEELFISRQALRQQIQTLEHQFNGALFYNEKNRLSLTPLGEYLKTNGSQILKDYENFINDISTFAAPNSEFRVGYCTSIQPFMWSNFVIDISEFMEKYQIKIITKRYDFDDLLNAIDQHECDCGIVFMLNPTTTCYELRPFKYYQIGVSHHKDITFKHNPITLEDLENHKIIGVGSLEKAMQPLYLDSKIHNIQLNYKVVPNTIDAFYQLSHKEAIMLDIAYDTIEIDNVLNTLFAEYQMFFGIIHLKDTLHTSSIEKFYKYSQSKLQNTI